MMGSRFRGITDEYLKNMCKTMSNFSMAHEGDPAISLEMVEHLMNAGIHNELYYSNLYQNIAFGLACHERDNSEHWKTISESELR
jgi:hypothetical protein